MNFIDSFLNRITMYRLVLYFLMALIGIAIILSAFGLLPFSPQYLILSSLLILIICWIANGAFARAYKVPANVESVYITALILALIIQPPVSLWDPAFLQMALWASVFAIASKYIVAIRKKHIFNPAAFGVAVTAFALGLSASWWVGTVAMLPAVLIGGLLVTRKILRSDLVFSFLAVGVVAILASHFSGFGAAPHFLWRIIADTPLFFFAFIMLTEPLTTPPTSARRMWYGTLVGFLFVPGWHVAGIASSPEIALLLGNIFAYIVSPKMRLVLTLKEKTQLTPDTYDLAFIPDQKVSFHPGQYLEWTIPAAGADNRGNRRYFTIASSPTESVVRMGVKMYPNGSTFKKTLYELQPGDRIVASQLAGDFTLPNDPARKLAFIAGGIGITPFRSMMRYMLDTGEKRDAVLLYSARTDKDIAYKDVFDEARKKLGMKTVYAVGAAEQLEPDMQVAMIDAEMIKREVPDYTGRQFYISGPRAMVTSFERTLSDMGVPRSHIVTDFFPGFV
jgi:glycine betaine catabolism B